MIHSSLKQKAYELIREKILNNGFEPGERIREDNIAEEIAMSRTPVREAINQLVAEGFIINIPRRGLFLVKLSLEDLNHLLDVREPLEVLAVEKCIDNIDDRGLQRLEDILAQYKEALYASDFKAYSHLDSQFHQEIARITGNKKLVEFIATLEGFMRIARSMEPRPRSKEVRDRSFQQHYTIYERIKSRDKEGAVAAIRKNVQGIKEKLQEKAELLDDPIHP